MKALVLAPDHLDRRTLISDAALAILGRGGPRALTHRAVDAEAGIPAGSTSYYYRTREALLTACVRRLIAVDQALIGEQAKVAAADRELIGDFRSGNAPADLVENYCLAITTMVQRWVNDYPHLLLARFSLSIETAQLPELSHELAAGRELARQRVTESLKAIGAPRPRRCSKWLIACLNGLMFEIITGTPFSTEEVHSSVRGLVATIFARGGTTPGDYSQPAYTPPSA